MFLTSHSAHHAPPFSAAWDPVHASPVSFPRTPRLRSDQGVWQILKNSNSKRDAFVWSSIKIVKFGLHSLQTIQICHSRIRCSSWISKKVEHYSYAFLWVTHWQMEHWWNKLGILNYNPWQLEISMSKVLSIGKSCNAIARFNQWGLEVNEVRTC